MEYYDDYLSSKEFKDNLLKYETARKHGGSIYMEPDDLTDIAEYYHSKGNWKEAQTAAEYAANLFPGSTSPLAFLTRLALYREHDIPKAQRYADQITDKSDMEYDYVQAEIMIVDNRMEEANRYLEGRYAQLEDEDKKDFVIDVADLYADYDMPALASKWLERSDEKDDDDYQELLGRIRMEQGNFEECEKIFNDLIDKNPYSSPYWNQLASSQFQRNDIKDSIASSEFSIAINPNDEEAILNKANGLYRLGNYEEALEYYKRYIRLCPKDEAGELYFATTLLNMNRLQEALIHLKKAEQMADSSSPNLIEIDQEMAFTLSRLGHLEEALDYVGKAEALNGTDVDDMMVLRGHLYLEHDQQEKAQACFQKAIHHSNSSPHIFLRIAVSVYDNGYIELAYRMFTALLGAVDEKWSEGYSYLAVCCHALGKKEECLKAVKKALEVNPQEAENVLSDIIPKGVDVADYYLYLKNE